MLKWATLDASSTVTNIVIADTQEIAEYVTGSKVVQVDVVKPVSIGWVLESDTLYPPKPNDGQSYVWVSSINSWVVEGTDPSTYSA